MTLDEFKGLVTSQRSGYTWSFRSIPAIGEFSARTKVTEEGTETEWVVWYHEDEELWTVTCLVTKRLPYALSPPQVTTYSRSARGTSLSKAWRIVVDRLSSKRSS